ncbi:MAG: hypothetical protein DRJ68_06010 [Thermoprotei archaeon]|nr:MAG: hypothetical protein DRJ68_06010 [Thermoprotei archaeon]
MKVLLWVPSADDESKAISSVLRSYGLEVKTVKGTISRARKYLYKSWNTLNFVIGIAPLPLCVRLISGLLKSKYEDPSVLCVTPDKNYVLCLCGEHFKGGKCLASLLAKAFKMRHILTSKLDLMDVTPLDELCFRLRLVPSDLRLLSDYVKCQAKGLEVSIRAPPKILRCIRHVVRKGYALKEPPLEEDVDVVVCQVNGLKPLILKPRKVVLGMGLCSVADERDVLSTVERALAVLKMPLQRLDALCIPDIRRGHPSLNALRKLVPLEHFEVQGLLRRSRSRGLCEELAIKLLKQYNFLIKKIKGMHTTAALAEGY